jgi:predicted ribosomally synthesized peptide with SipW-like signal peptide
MTKSKKSIISVCLVVALLCLGVVGASLAYFTDTDSETNTFTIGNVSIDLIESQLHRVNAGVETDGRLSTADVAMEGAAGTAPEDSYNWAGKYFTDEQIQADAANYQNVYLAEEGQNMVPGKNVMKCPYVINDGANDAYVRVRVLIPAVLDNGILGNSMYTSTAISSGACTMAVTNNKTVDGKVYNEYAFTFVDPLAPGQMTFWNVWGDIMLSSNATSEQIQALIASGDLTTDGSFGVLVQADAIQAEGFADAAAAFAAFDAQ